MPDQLTLLLVAWLVGWIHCSRITVDSDGGYRNVVIKIADNVPEDLCFTLLQNIKVSKHLI